jgi:AraC family transcriptional regulator
MIDPVIQILAEKKLIGKRLTMSVAVNKTFQLWQSFMPRRKEIIKNISDDLISMRLYGNSYFDQIDLHAKFEKWAAVEVTDIDAVPDGLESFILPGGLYAVFHYKGLNTDSKIFQYIYGTWLPASVYTLDNRPHFEILGEKYRNNDPDSEEEIWIPVRPK